MISASMCFLQLLILSLLQHCCTFINRNMFIRKLEFDGRLCNPNNLQAFGYRESKLSCSEACAEDVTCSGFFYNTVNKSCHGSQIVYTSTVSCSENVGTYYYSEENGAATVTTSTSTTQPPVGVFGSQCNNNADCLSPNTECWDNICTCTPGYTLNPDTLECTSGCGVYGSDYLEYNGYDMTCLISTHLKNAEYCQGLCTTNPSCRAVARDNFLNNCRLMSCTPRTHPLMWLANNNCVSYIRNCDTSP